MVASDNAEYTRQSRVTEDESERHENNKDWLDENKLCTGKEWRLQAQ